MMIPAVRGRLKNKTKISADMNPIRMCHLGNMVIRDSFYLKGYIIMFLVDATNLRFPDTTELTARFLVRDFDVGIGNRALLIFDL